MMAIQTTCSNPYFAQATSSPADLRATSSVDCAWATSPGEPIGLGASAARMEAAAVVATAAGRTAPCRASAAYVLVAAGAEAAAVATAPALACRLHTRNTRPGSSLPH